MYVRTYINSHIRATVWKRIQVFSSVAAVDKGCAIESAGKIFFKG